MDPVAAKQQITERVKQANKFLVTVNSNPTVDQLAACIGLTLMLNKMGKHATAVFSGQVPSTIEFLQPDKTLEPTADSLRDFIISLDKNKADKLRYKVEDQFVRIFITPYRTSLSQKDLVFSEGDYNVEVVIALGITQRAQIDAAITAHGRILHDATVVSVNVGTDKAPDIGQINWVDNSASSLCEMLVSISEALGQGLIDNQIATAFLTGIVAETERFSNKRTSPKVMTMSAQLMAAGANQQLISAKLEPPPPPPPKKPPAPPPKPPEPKKPKQPPLKPEGVLDVSHDEKKDSGEVEVLPTEIHIDEQGNLQTIDNSPVVNQSDQVQTISPAKSQPMEESTAEAERPQPLPAPSEMQNRHAYVAPPASSAMTGIPQTTGQPEWASPYDLVPMDPASGGDGMDEDIPSGRPMPAPHDQESKSSVDELGMSVPTQPTPISTPVNKARDAVENALATAPFDPSFSPPAKSLNSQLLPAVPHSEHADTPELALPSQAPQIVQTASPPTPVEETLPSVPPPPVPPPLMTAPGAVIPNVSQQ